MKTIDEALTPVRSALLARAHAEADLIRERSEVDAQQTVEAATAEAGRIRRTARAEGEAQAATAATAARNQARREARALVLGARREAYERLRDAAREAVGRIADEPEVRRRLVAAVRATLGPEARIVDAPGGGVIGVAAGRRLDLSLTGFADRALERVLGEQP